MEGYIKVFFVKRSNGLTKGRCSLIILIAMGMSQIAAVIQGLDDCWMGGKVWASNAHVDDIDSRSLHGSHLPELMGKIVFRYVGQSVSRDNHLIFFCLGIRPRF